MCLPSWMFERDVVDAYYEKMAKANLDEEAKIRYWGVDIPLGGGMMNKKEIKMTREGAIRKISETLNWLPSISEKMVDVWIELGMLKVDKEITIEHAIYKARSNCRSYPEDQTDFLNNLKDSGYKVTKL